MAGELWLELETKNVTSSVQSVIMAVAAQRHMPWPVLEMCPQPCQEAFRSAWDLGCWARLRARVRASAHPATQPEPGPCPTILAIVTKGMGPSRNLTNPGS